MITHLTKYEKMKKKKNENRLFGMAAMHAGFT